MAPRSVRGMLNDEPFHAAIGRLALQSAHVEWLQAAVLERLKPDGDQRDLKALLGLARERRCKEIVRGGKARQLPDRVQAQLEDWVNNAEGLLEERDKIVHSVLVMRGDNTWWLQHGRTETVQAADTGAVFALELRMGGCGSMGIALLRYLYDQ
jgi:hypothetical protein